MLGLFVATETYSRVSSGYHREKFFHRDWKLHPPVEYSNFTTSVDQVFQSQNDLYRASRIVLQTAIPYTVQHKDARLTHLVGAMANPGFACLEEFVRELVVTTVAEVPA